MDDPAFTKRNYAMNGNGFVKDISSHWRSYLILAGLVFQTGYFYSEVTHHTQDQNLHKTKVDQVTLNTIENGSVSQSVVKDKIDWATWRAEVTAKLDRLEQNTRTPEQVLELFQVAIDQMLREQQSRRYRSATPQEKK